MMTMINSKSMHDELEVNPWWTRENHELNDKDMKSKTLFSMLMVSLVGFTSLFVAACNDNDSEAGRVYSADCIRFNLQGVQSMPRC